MSKNKWVVLTHITHMDLKCVTCKDCVRKTQQRNTQRKLADVLLFALRVTRKLGGLIAMMITH